MPGSGKSAGSAAFFCPGAMCSPGQTAIAVVASPVNVSLDQKLEWFSTIRGRAGYTITPTVLGYVTGGLAIGEVKSDVVVTGRTGGVGAPFVSSFSTDRSTRVGWTVGAGVEASLGGNWTGKLEYLDLDLGRESFSAVNLANATPVRADFSSEVTDHILRAGVNYRFGGPVVARY